MEYEIIATLGPSTSSKADWQAMLTAGVTAFRINTSHLSLSQLLQWLERLDPLISSGFSNIPVVLDLQGSKWRLGIFSPFETRENQPLRLVYGNTTQAPDTLPVPHQDFFEAAQFSNGRILLDDARILLVMESSADDTITARVLQSGPINSQKGITYESSAYRKESITEKDHTILGQTRHLDYLRYAISYVKDSREMAAYRSLAGQDRYLIAKLERKPAISDALHIADHADELWLCRGDLGAELGMKEMSEAVFQFSRTVPGFPIPVIMAGQVLQHMTTHPSPTRSELCYLYETLLRGYRGIVLSDETAVGKYPLESCKFAALYKE